MRPCTEWQGTSESFHLLPTPAIRLISFFARGVNSLPHAFESEQWRNVSDHRNVGRF